MLTIPQASKQTGKHQDTIRRIIKNLLKTDLEAKGKITQEKTKKGFHYLIEEKYLLKHLQPLQQPMQGENSKNTDTASNQPLHQAWHKVDNQPLQQGMQQPMYAEVKAKDETIAILKKQLEQKDEQIKQLLERDRETNVLLRGYQERFLLPAGKPNKDVVINAKQTQKKKQAKNQNRKTEIKKKKGIFWWLS